MTIAIILLTLYSIVITIMFVRANASVKFDILRIPAKSPLPEPWGDKVWAELAFGEPTNDN